MAFRLLILIGAALAASMLPAQSISEAEIINRARATVGTDQVLDGLVTLRMVGALEPADPAMPRAMLLIVARKPASQRLEIRVDDMVETTILNCGKACMIRSNLEAGASQMRDLEGAELERVIYSTKQFFNYYRPDFKNGETVRLEGIENHRGERAYKLRYAYPDGIETIRYFSVNDDRLLATITSNGVESVGVGRQTIGGISFPQQIDYFEDGRKLHTIVLDSIEVNKPLAEGIFRIPRGEPSGEPPG